MTWQGQSGSSLPVRPCARHPLAFWQSLGGVATVYDQLTSGHVLGLFRRQIEYGIGDIVWLSNTLGVKHLHVRQVLLETSGQELPCFDIDRREDGTGANRIHADVLAGVSDCLGLRHEADGAFGRMVGRGIGISGQAIN